MARVDIDGGKLVIEMEGLDKLWSLKSRLEIPLANVRGADRIVVLERGRLIEQGRHQELMALSGTYQQLFSLQADAYHAEFDARSP